MSHAGALEGLKLRVLRASGWSVLGQIGSQAVRFAGSLIMTRLLVPELFGVMSLAMMFVVALGMFSDLGLGQIVVRHRSGDDKAMLNTVWTTQVLRGLLIALAGALIALALLVLRNMGVLPHGSAYAHPDLPTALFVNSLASIVGGFESTKTLTAMRSLSLRNIAIMEFSSQIVGLGATVVWALVSPTIFAVTGGAVASVLTRTALSHTLFDGVNNRFHWSKEHFREIIGFGRWVFLSSILGFLISNGDRMLLGAFLDARRFGIYSVAALIVGAVFDLCGRLITSVVYPALNETYRKEPSKLKATYYRLRTPVEAVCCIAAGIMIVAGPQMIEFLYDNRYAEAGVAIQIMSIPMIFVGLNSSENIYMVLGKPWLLTILNGVRLVALYATVPYLAYHYGLIGGAVGVVASHVAKVPAIYYMKIKYGYLSLKRELLIFPFLMFGFLLGYGFTVLLTILSRH